MRYFVIGLVALLTGIGFVYLQGLGSGGNDLAIADHRLRLYPTEAKVVLSIENKKRDTLRVASAYVESHYDTERVDLGKCTVYTLAPNEEKTCETIVDKAVSYRIAGVEGYERRDLSIRKLDIPLK